MSSGLARYYDRLGRWNRVARAIGYGGGSSALTVHRALADPSVAGRPTFTRLHDILIEQLPPMTRPRVLDAGCGLGGTMLALARALHATCVGVTLSPPQAATANAQATRAGLAGDVRAIVGSYDAPPAGSFDLVIAIESLAHSPDPARSVQALASVVAPGGCFVVVDDMPEPSAQGLVDLARFKAGWQCPVLWSADAFVHAMTTAGLVMQRDVDLTSGCRPRGARTIALMMRLNRAVRLLPSEALRQVMDSHFGGLALERLTRGGHMRYRMLVARRPAVRVS